MPYTPPDHSVWFDDEGGGTPIEASDCNRWETNQSDASQRVDNVSTLVASYEEIPSLRLLFENGLV